MIPQSHRQNARFGTRQNYISCISYIPKCGMFVFHRPVSAGPAIDSDRSFRSQPLSAFTSVRLIENLFIITSPPPLLFNVVEVVHEDHASPHTPPFPGLFWGKKHPVDSLKHGNIQHLTLIPCGKVRWQWSIPIFNSIHTSSSQRVDFRASYVGLPKNKSKISGTHKEKAAPQ